MPWANGGKITLDMAAGAASAHGAEADAIVGHFLMQRRKKRYQISQGCNPEEMSDFGMMK